MDNVKAFGLLCEQVTRESSLTVKAELIGGFIGRYGGDLGLLLKLLLPKYSGRIYYVQEKQLLRVLSLVLAAPEDSLKAEWQRNGCVAETAQAFFRSTADLDADGWCGMTLRRFDSFLDQMASAATEKLRVDVVKSFMAEACSHAVYLFFREVKLDLRLGAGLRVVLGGLHPSAYHMFQHCADVQEVVRRVQAGSTAQSEARPSAPSTEHETSAPDGEDSRQAAHAASVPSTAPTPPALSERRAERRVSPQAVAGHIRIGFPLAPMLAAPAKSVDQVLAKCPNGAFSEVKYDGERIQIHKQCGTLTFFARSLKPMRADKYAGLEPFLHNAIQADECILDGEILMVDIHTSIPLPFGTLGKHKKAQFATACPCVFLFDILYKDGKALLQVPLSERRKELKKAVVFIRNRVMFSELCIVDGDPKQRRAILQQHLSRAIAEGLEGLVIKDMQSCYEPRARHWLKIKKDYLDGLADSADLLVLGAWFGSGSKGGQLSTFLMGCADRSVPEGQPGRYRTVCKVGNGLDDTAITALSHKYSKCMTAPSRGVAPAWLDCCAAHLPDMVVRDPTQADVMEVIGAEFSMTKTHTAGISIRFPRIHRMRADKDVNTATNLQELLALFRASKERLTAAGLPDTLQLADSYVVAPAGDAAEVEDGAVADDRNMALCGDPPYSTPAEKHLSQPVVASSLRREGDSAAGAPASNAGTVESGVVAASAGGTPSALPKPLTLAPCWWSMLAGVRAQIVVGPGAASGRAACEIDELRSTIAMLGGEAVRTDCDYAPSISCTHVVLAGAHAAAPSSFPAVPPGTALVSAKWVEDCLLLHARHAEALYHPKLLTVLSGCRVVFALAVHDRAKWKRLASLLGATIHQSWALVGQRSTHCVSTAWDEDAENAFRLGGRVVDVQWLADSAAAQTELPVDAYLLPRPHHGTKAQARRSPIDGVLGGLRVYVSTAELSAAFAAALMAAVEQMGGFNFSTAADAQYCVLSTEAYRQQCDSLSPAVRYRCVTPDWLWASAQQLSLQDPTAYMHSRTALLGSGQRQGSRRAPSAAEDVCADSAYSTETYAETELDMRVDEEGQADGARGHEDSNEPPLKMYRNT